MSITAPAGNQTAGFATDLFWHRGDHLRRSASVAGLNLIVSVVIGVIGWYQQRSTPRPDY